MFVLRRGEARNWGFRPSDLLRPRQSAQVAVNDNAIKTVINEDEKIAEQGEQLHDRPPKTDQVWTGQAHG